jgi:HSP20 family molecular chaperone IbpA
MNTMATPTNPATIAASTVPTVPTAPASAAQHAAEPSSDIASRAIPTLIPPVDVIEDSTGITLIADVPGVAREKLTLRVEADQLCIEGDLSMPMPPNLETGYAEVQRSRFRRTFTLSKELDAEKIGAELSNGVLRLRIPKVAYAQPRRIPIQAG